jgi:hypothetical protein
LNEFKKQVFRKIRKALKPGLDSLQEWLKELTVSDILMIVQYLQALVKQKQDGTKEAQETD